MGQKVAQIAANDGAHGRRRGMLLREVQPFFARGAAAAEAPTPTFVCSTFALAPAAAVSASSHSMQKTRQGPFPLLKILGHAPDHSAWAPLRPLTMGGGAHDGSDHITRTSAQATREATRRESKEHLHHGARSTPRPGPRPTFPVNDRSATRCGIQEDDADASGFWPLRPTAFHIVLQPVSAHCSPERPRVGLPAPSSAARGDARGGGGWGRKRRGRAYCGAACCFWMGRKSLNSGGSSSSE